MLSIVMPTNRVGLGINARILHACSWANEDIEVIIRDNSGDNRKQRFLLGIKGVADKIVAAEPCTSEQNITEAFKLATGDFVQLIADDDIAFERGIWAISQQAKIATPEIAGILGCYMLTQSQGEQIVDYQALASDSPMDRLQGYLSFQGPNLLFYPAIRRDIGLNALRFFSEHPFPMSFHDQIVSLIYLLSGKFARTQRIGLVVDNHNWESADVGIPADLKHYASNGLDPILRQVHWLICGFEGAAIINSQPINMGMKEAMVTTWLSTMNRRFMSEQPSDHGSSISEEQVRPFRDRLARYSSSQHLPDMLDDIAAIVKLFDLQKALAYMLFWSNIGVVRATSGLEPKPPIYSGHAA